MRPFLFPGNVKQLVKGNFKMFQFSDKRHHLLFHSERNPNEVICTDLKLESSGISAVASAVMFSLLAVLLHITYSP